jgi:hypothetical protein
MIIIQKMMKINQVKLLQIKMRMLYWKILAKFWKIEKFLDQSNQVLQVINIMTWLAK